MDVGLTRKVVTASSLEDTPGPGNAVALKVPRILNLEMGIGQKQTKEAGSIQRLALCRIHGSLVR